MYQSVGVFRRGEVVPLYASRCRGGRGNMRSTTKAREPGEPQRVYVGVHLYVGASSEAVVEEGESVLNRSDDGDMKDRTLTLGLRDQRPPRPRRALRRLTKAMDGEAAFVLRAR